MTRHEVHAAAATIVALFLLAAIYMGSCLVKPKTWCWLCKGHVSRTNRGRNWGDCWWCGGDGYRLRYGKRIYERWARRRRK